jgi:nitroreductase
MAKQGIESVLKIPKDLSMICLIAVGYPDESPRKDRNPVDQVLEFVG